MKLDINFLQTGGVPLTNDLMNNIMDAIKFYDVLGRIAGDKTILYGCEPLGGSTTVVTSGVVAIDGEILPFEGGTITPDVYIVTEEFLETFEDQTDKVLVIKKKVVFGSSVNSFVWADFIKLQTLAEMQASLADKVDQTDFDDLVDRVEVLERKTAPIINGGIVWIWKLPASEIPNGWKECTDLRGKTVFGHDPNDATFDTLGNTGGNKQITQTLAQMPKHSHSYTRTSPWAGSGGGFDGGGNPFSVVSTNTSEAGNNEPR